jgi:hypothetical protein
MVSFTTPAARRAFSAPEIGAGDITHSMVKSPAL